MTKRTRSRLDHIVELFKAKQPKNVEAMRKLGIKIRGLDSGVFRKVYKITGVPLVVKIPQHTGGSCKKHAVAEYRAVQAINKNKSNEGLRKFMPVIYYFDKETGIMLVHYYKPLDPKYRHVVSRLMLQIVELLWTYAMKGRSIDIHSGNVAMDPEDNQPKLIDLGYFSDYGKGY